MMAAIAGTPLQHFSGEAAVAEREAILNRLHCGITDMGHTIVRSQNNSLDENLQIVEFMDLLHLLELHPGLQRVVFTSSSGSSSALGWFLQYMKAKGLQVKFPKGPKPWKAMLDVNGRPVELHVLLSPSPRAANRYGLGALVNLYGSVICQAPG